MGVLLELRVENLVLIERAELRLAPGLNVITGETGAGKTMLADGLDLLLGGRARGGIVRPGAAEAYVEGVFERPPRLGPEWDERIAPDAEEIVLARRVGADGRTRAYVNGRSANVADLRELAPSLIAFYGQHEHRRLTLASAQLEALDAYCGPHQQEGLAACAAAAARRDAAAAEVERLAGLAGARERELDLLEFEIAEIDEVGPSEAESAELERERGRLQAVDALRRGALAAAEALAPESGGPGATFLLAAAEHELDGAAGADPELDALAARFRSLRYEAEELGGELRRFEGSIEAPPGRLDEVEDRLAQFARLARKHGGSIADVLAHGERCRARRDELAGAEVALEAANAELAAASAELEAAAAELAAARRKAAPKLAAAVRERLAQLAMADASFEVALSARERIGADGGDRAEFVIAPNPGVPAAPLREIGSGGEISRVMLALMGSASATPGQAHRVLVFDEIDAGIGGHTARAVGEQLRALAEGRQVLCITHLPQVASLAVRHFRIAKDVEADTTRTTVTALAQQELVGELVRMLGADEGDSAATDHAKELLKAA